MSRCYCIASLARSLSRLKVRDLRSICESSHNMRLFNLFFGENKFRKTPSEFG